MAKEITIALYKRNFLKDWFYEIRVDAVQALAAELDAELGPAGVRVFFSGEEDVSIDVKGYGDMLNSIRLRSSEFGVGSPCLGHIIGESSACDLLADIKKGVSRLAFAPETIMPDAAHRQTCHNCGCGC